MQKTILMIVAVALVGCGTTTINNPIIEGAIRKKLSLYPDGVHPRGSQAVLKFTGPSFTGPNSTSKHKNPAKAPLKLTKAQMEMVTDLSFSGNKLTDVKDLEKLTQLKGLSLRNNKLTELPKGLEKLTQLTRLDLYDNKLTDVTGLEKLTQLKELILWNNKLTDVTGLEKLTQLELLDLSGNDLTDVKGLEKLTQLTRLDLVNAHVTNVTGLEKLTNLTYLDLDHNHDLTKAQIAELQKALPKCKILGNFKK